MKAIQYRSYGAPEVLHIVDVAQPVPKPNEVLVRVHEAILTPTDISGRSGKPFIVRFFNGLARPKGIPGTDFAGVVEAVGEKVTRFQPGDRVVGAKMPNTGAHAEYVTLAEKGVLTKLPQGVEFSHLAGMCDAAMTALTFLRDDAVLKPGQRVLIIGAAGGIGTFAVQMTKHMGAHVTGVCSTPYVDQVRTLGADAVIDRTKTDFTQIGETYDVIFDAVGKSSFTKCRKALSAKGKYLTTVLGNNILGSMLWTKMTGGKRAIFDATGLKQTQEKADTLVGWVADGRLKAVVDRTYSLDQMAEAHAYVETGHKHGNIVITLPIAAKA